MPKIFEYFGLIFFFYSNEHEPIHVHVMKNGQETVISETESKTATAHSIIVKANEVPTGYELVDNAVKTLKISSN